MRGGISEGAAVGREEDRSPELPIMWLPLLGGVQDTASLLPPSQHLRGPSSAATGRVA